MKKILSLTIVAIATMVFSGCGTVELQTFASTSNSIFFNSLKAKKTIYMVSKNSTQVDSKLGELVKSRLIHKGYVLVEDPEKAQYILKINAVNFNRSSEQNTLKAAGTGAVTGAIAGVAVSRNVRGGLVGGAIAGGVAGIFALATEDGDVKMQADVLIQEKTGEGLKTHQTRVYAEATQMHLTAKKAQPILEKIIAKKISGIF